MSNSLLEERIFKVSELNNQIKLYLEPAFARIRVLGESSGVTLSTAGHLYFTLKDETAAIRVVMFRGSLIKSTLRKLENGQQIVVKGGLSMYPPRGEIQIVAQDIQLKGKGDIFAALEKLKQLYQEKGYFDLAIKKPVPMAQMVGDKGQVIAAHLQQQMLDMLRRRAERSGVADRI